MRLAFLTLAAALPAALIARGAEAPVTVIAHARVAAAFAKGSPLVETADYKIHASRREGPGVAEIHTRDTDIAYVLQGSATLITGGTADAVKSIGAEELRGAGITGGETRRLVPGDVVVIPNGVPHWFSRVEAPFVYYVVKVRQAERPEPTGAR